VLSATKIGSSNHGTQQGANRFRKKQVYEAHKQGSEEHLQVDPDNASMIAAKVEVDTLFLLYFAIPDAPLALQ
jgi:hypothetical protein